MRYLQKKDYRIASRTASISIPLIRHIAALIFFILLTCDIFLAGIYPVPLG